MPLTNIQILRSAVPYKRPDPTFLLDGQLAINYKLEEPGLFTKLQDGGMIKIGPTSITNTGDAPNANPDVGGVAGNLIAEKWFDARPIFYSGVEKIWDGTAWQTVSGFEIDDLTGNMTMMRELTLEKLITNAADILGPLAINGNVTPFGTTCVHELGLAGERWNGIFGCSLDILNDAQVGNDMVIINDTTIGGSTAIGGDLSVNGGDNTFGQSCADTAFTIESPAFLNCDTSIIGNITAGGSLDMVGDLTVDGSIQLGQGCGVSTLTVDADTTFNCPVTFASTAFVFGDGCLTSTIEFNGATQFNCDSLPNVGSALDIGSPAATFNAMYADNFEGGIFNGGSLTLTGKGQSDLTVAGDLPATLVTKSYVDAEIIAGTANISLWEQNGNDVSLIDPNLDIVPNGTTSIGADANRFTAVYANDLFTNDLHLKNDRGDWTMIEEEDCLTIRNNKTGQRYAISMTPYNP